MKRAVMVAQGLLFFSAVVPGVAVAGLNAANVAFGDVQQGVSVTKSVTVTNTAPGFHYLLDPSGSGLVTTVASGSCPSGNSSLAINTCQIQVTLLTGVIGFGGESVDMGYQYDDMPFSANDAVSTSSFTILATYSVVAPDSDSDGVVDSLDLCPNTPVGESVDDQGCAPSQKDDDGDGVANDIDLCPNTPVGESVDAQGCAPSQKDDDGDGVANDIDLCPNTPVGESVDAQGCAPSQKDDDGDGVANDIDLCPNTPPGESVDAQGCAQSQKDDDGDGVANDIDQCPNTPVGESVDDQGCAPSQKDDDGDGVANDIDLCPNTPPGESVDAQGCAQSEQADAPQTGLPIWLLYEATK